MFFFYQNSLTFSFFHCLVIKFRFQILNGFTNENVLGKNIFKRHQQFFYKIIYSNIEDEIQEWKIQFFLFI